MVPSLAVSNYMLSIDSCIAVREKVVDQDGQNIFSSDSTPIVNDYSA
jgi:hypothetical protein